MKGQNSQSSVPIIPLTAKAGVIGMTKTAAKEMGLKGINVFKSAIKAATDR